MGTCEPSGQPDGDIYSGQPVAPETCNTTQTEINDANGVQCWAVTASLNEAGTAYNYYCNFLYADNETLYDVYQAAFPTADNQSIICKIAS